MKHFYFNKEKTPRETMSFTQHRNILNLSRFGLDQKLGLCFLLLTI